MSCTFFHGRYGGFLSGIFALKQVRGPKVHIGHFYGLMCTVSPCAGSGIPVLKELPYKIPGGGSAGKDGIRPLLTAVDNENGQSVD